MKKLKIVLTNNRLLALSIFTASLFIPNIAILLGGLYGSFLTYFTWSILIAVAIPILLRNGRGSLSTLDSILLALILITITSILGFIFGFDVRRYPTSLLSFLTTVGIFLVEIIGIEVGRSAAISLIKHPAIRVALATLSGIVIGLTAPALLKYISRIYSRPIPLLEDLLYSLTLSLIHEFGGLSSGVVFRVFVDGYWRFSPIVLTTTIPATLRSAILMLTYYGLINLIITATKSLRGVSRKLFEFSYRRKLRFLPEVLSIAIAMAILILTVNKFIPLVVSSGSMSPTLNIGDIVFIHAIGGAGISIGDIIAFKMEDRQIVVHRVIDVGPDWVKTKGDANPHPDPFLVSYNDILGKVVFIVPRIGYISIALQIGGWATYLSIVVLIVIATSLIYIKKYVKDRKLKFYSVNKRWWLSYV